ncbi:MAG TPA: hydantoinase/oxoprolinase family protein [Thermoleophilaceae bacterium]|nr:hydantoinase/oxoprolinase family protein [Thermoleophilaceae bacterium]
MASRLGVDVGGTFTDLVFYDHATGEVRVGKGSTVPASPDVGVKRVVSDTLESSELAASDLFLHGTTVGINSIVQRNGAVVGLLTTGGFRDVLETRRADRDEFYNMLWKPSEPLVPRRLRIDVTERVLADGSVHKPLDEGEVRSAAARFIEEGVESIAVIFINAHTFFEHELAAERVLRDAGFEGGISLSHQVTGEYREYERTSTTVIDAYVRPRVSTYLRDLSTSLREEQFDGEFLVTRSGGGSMPFSEAELRPFETVMSGPVAGAAGAAELCRNIDVQLAVTADVGGTTFDTCMILDGQAQVKYQGFVAGMPLQTAWVDVRSIGAGGGSIAFEDAGLLHVGPRSAGADPGPVCYGRGGVEPTVTDAAATLGMLAFGELAGGVTLDIPSAEAAIAELGKKISLDTERTAQGVIEITAVAMANAIRAILEEVGENPAEAAVLAFGGAGPLFGSLIAKELGAKTIVVPNYAGNFSAWGLLLQDLSRSAARSVLAPLDDSGLEAASNTMRDLRAGLEQRISEASTTLASSARIVSNLDLRYDGQEYFLTIEVPFEDGRIAISTDELAKSFATDYERRYGHALGAPVEIVAVRLTAITPLPKTNLLSNPGTTQEPRPRRSIDAFSFAHGQREKFEVVDRAELEVGSRHRGPMIVLEETATTYVDADLELEVHPSGTLLLHEIGGANNGRI